MTKSYSDQNVYINNGSNDNVEMKWVVHSDKALDTYQQTAGIFCKNKTKTQIEIESFTNNNDTCLESVLFTDFFLFLTNYIIKSLLILSVFTKTGDRMML